MKILSLIAVSDGALIDRLFTMFDKDGNGFLNYTEFLKFIREPMSYKRLRAVVEVFNLLDKDRDGYITRENITDQWRSGALFADKEIAEELIRICDLDSDGNISLDEFTQYYESLSRVIDDDDHFVHMVRNSWHLLGSDTFKAKEYQRKVLATSPDNNFAQ